MKQYKKVYNPWNRVVAIIMIMTLAWLTISTPFVYSAQQQASKITSANHCLPDSGDCNPFGNTTEEKAPSGVNTFSEEYLHHNDELFHNAELFLGHNRSHSAEEYIAFHGELLSPPPDCIFN